MYAIPSHDITKILKIVPIIEYNSKNHIGREYAFASINCAVDYDATQIPE